MSGLNWYFQSLFNTDSLFLCLLCADETKHTSQSTHSRDGGLGAGVLLNWEGLPPLPLWNLIVECPFFMGSLPHRFIFPNLFGVSR